MDCLVSTSAQWLRQISHWYRIWQFIVLRRYQRRRSNQLITSRPLNRFLRTLNQKKMSRSIELHANSIADDIRERERANGKNMKFDHDLQVISSVLFFAHYIHSFFSHHLTTTSQHRKLRHRRINYSKMRELNVYDTIHCRESDDQGPNTKQHRKYQTKKTHFQTHCWRCRWTLVRLLRNCFAASQADRHRSLRHVAVAADAVADGAGVGSRGDLD